ncbi:isopenicillin N synthase family dioxygenase [Larsenimonas rhizosphaerae]|uniref:2-oxoglutarate-dependent ethylene/succinate-forming enzyme n=1 Tax=Larsenimonas rhizosphaerae TaxID=2944682 RepID=A0AA41ZKC3_9GAMM|nr:2OG-Fe(II) oxygenase family protein [Larsenimonas rhizosphaerae]MCM2130554.1 isopenicillin N synthase family oxygenase [Larsenimonas rhizosphaerae]MCX2523258.1 isopenicillin N synthase family oxygenase [Larsenimonas rhizosphaerae]
MPVQNVDYKKDGAAEDFVASLKETGFGVIRNHPIDMALVERIYEQWAAFFDSEEKQQWRFDPKTQDGYFPADVSETAKGASQKDLKEYYHVYPWGKVPDALEEDIRCYYRQANALAGELLSWIERYSPAQIAKDFSEPLSDMIADSQQTLLRILYYPPMAAETPVDAVRAAAHEDINLITLLPAANEPGLEVMGRDGEWMAVPCDPGQLIINVGDMLQEASGGHFPSTTHRVVNPEGDSARKARLSLPLFLHPRPDVRLSDRYTADSYLKERLKELGVI